MDSDPLVVHAAAEIAEMSARGPMQLMLQPLSVLRLAGALQLAARHPQLPNGTRTSVETFLRGAREYFADCPAILDMLRRGDDPAYDVPFRDRSLP